MSLFDKIQKGKRPGPRRILLYGDIGVGKSQFASNADSPIFIDAEDGLGSFDVKAYPLVTSFQQVMDCLADLYSRKDHGYRTLAVDSLDKVESFIWNEVMAKFRVDSVETIGFGKGFAAAMVYWRRLLQALTDLRRDHDMTILLIAHCKIEKHPTPELEPLDRYTPSLHQKSSDLFLAWADEVLFCCKQTYTTIQDGEFGKKRVVAAGTGKRVLRTTESPNHLAKNRLGLPEELPLEWPALAKYIAKAREVNNG